MKQIAILGEKEQSGAYLLRMKVRRELRVRFGRFQGGRPLLVPQGDALYVGSAMAQRGSMSLARRLLRHATRQDAHLPQPIRNALLAALHEGGLGSARLKPPVQKKLFWNIDFLLEEVDVELIFVVIIRSKVPLEDELALFIENEPGSFGVAKGLGAHDRSGATHLFMIKKSAVWWNDLPERLNSLYDEILK